MSAQRNAVRHFQRLPVDDIQRAVRFIADVDMASVWCGCGAVAYFDVVNLADNLVCDRIDNVDVVARGIGLNDTNLAGGGLDVAQRLPTHPVGERLPFNVVSRLPMFAAVMARITSRGFRERMQQQPACLRLAGNDFQPDGVEVLARFFLVPRSGPG